MRVEVPKMNYRKANSYMKQVMAEHEIDKAIRDVVGPRDFDPKIRRIWERFIKPPK